MEKEEDQSGKNAKGSDDETVGDCQTNMIQTMQRSFKWSQRDLHDAVISARLALPGHLDLLGYFTVLHQAFGENSEAFMPQNSKSHTAARLKAVLKILSRSGARLGKLQDKKQVLAQRLAYWLQKVFEAGRMPSCVSDEADSSGDPDAET